MHARPQPPPTVAAPPRPADPRLRIGDADLEPLVRDLPAPTRPSRPPAPVRRPLLDDRVRTYLAVMALLWLIWLVTGANYPWPIWPMLGWGIGVAGHAGRAWSAR
jgi:2TM domain